jgi:hypothetical protein
MYAWLFSRLPGPRWLQVVQALAVVALAVWALMQFVFPWLSDHVAPFSPFTDSTIGTTE